MVILVCAGLGIASSPAGWAQERPLGKRPVANQTAGRSVAPPLFEITLRPVREGGTEVKAIEIREELHDAPRAKAKKEFTLRAPLAYASVTGIAERIQKLEVRDASGIVPLTVKDDRAKSGGMPYFRHWRAVRDVAGRVFISYRSVPQTTRAAVGPQFSFRAHSGGISAAGSGFLALPEEEGAFQVRCHWDLGGLDRGAIAVSTFGEGDFERRGPLNELIEAFYLAGPLGRYSSERETSFAGYWLGKPTFDPQTEMAWAAECYAYQKKFFRDVSPPLYRMFVRSLPDAPPRMGGTALGPSFLIAVGEGTGPPPRDILREMIAHEMMHMFIGLSVGERAGPWYEEGLTEYYTNLLLLRSGFVTLQDYERSVNRSVGGYFSNPYRNRSAANLAELGFSAGVGGSSAQNVPYTRGRLYFATVDAKIRAASGRRRKLDDVIRLLFKQRGPDLHVDVPTLIAAFEKEYGREARTDFESVIVRGETIVPPEDAFGPGFRRRAKKFGTQGKDVDGYEWVRDPSVPDAQVRKW